MRIIVHLLLVPVLLADEQQPQPRPQHTESLSPEGQQTYNQIQYSFAAEMNKLRLVECLRLAVEGKIKAVGECGPFDG